MAVTPKTKHARGMTALRVSRRYVRDLPFEQQLAIYVRGGGLFEDDPELHQEPLPNDWVERAETQTIMVFKAVRTAIDVQAEEKAETQAMIGLPLPPVPITEKKKREVCPVTLVPLQLAIIEKCRVEKGGTITKNDAVAALCDNTPMKHTSATTSVGKFCKSGLLYFFDGLIRAKPENEKENDHVENENSGGAEPTDQG